MRLSRPSSAVVRTIEVAKLFDRDLTRIHQQSLFHHLNDLWKSLALHCLRRDLKTLASFHITGRLVVFEFHL